MFHNHDYISGNSIIQKNQKKTLAVMLISVLMMIVEIIVGYISGSMALSADGWHMASHVGALSINLLVYKLASSSKVNQYFTFGAGKLIPLGGYTSAIVLAVMAILMIIESVEHLIEPSQIQFSEAIVVAAIGLFVNLLSAFILRHDHAHMGHDHEVHAHCDHPHEAGHDHAHHSHNAHEQHHDYNLASAYAHVLADAFTSLLAIAALIVGKYWGTTSLDPIVGIFGSFVILKWAYGLVKDTVVELLDKSREDVYLPHIKKALAPFEAQVLDLHIWKVAPHAVACELVVSVPKLAGSAIYENLLKKLIPIKHIIVEERLR